MFVERTESTCVVNNLSGSAGMPATTSSGGKKSSEFQSALSVTRGKHWLTRQKPAAAVRVARIERVDYDPAPNKRGAKYLERTERHHASTDPG